MCRVNHDHINVGFYQSIDTFHHISCDTNAGATEKTAEIIFG